MSLVYRAIWQDDRPDLVPLARTAFGRWVERETELRVTESGPYEHVVEGADARVSVSVRDASADGIEALHAVLRRDSGDERSVTTLRAMVRAGEQWLWVDVERVAENIWERSMAASPRLVRDLITDGEQAQGRPRWGPVRLSAKFAVADPKRLAETCLNLLLHPGRESPVVVLAHDYGLGSAGTIEAAQKVVDQLVGIAKVIVLPPTAINDFNHEVGADLSIRPGEVRLYLPNPGASAAREQNRVIDEGVLRRHPEEAGRRICTTLVQSIASRRAPQAYDDIRRLFQQSSGQSNDELLVEYERELDARDEQIRRLNAEVSRVQAEHLHALAELESLQEQQRKLQDSVVQQLLKPGGADEAMIGNPECVTEAIDSGRRYLQGVVIAEGAGRDLDKLDRAVEARSWGRTIWSGLLALNAYALEGGRYRGSFYDWCRDSGHRLVWPSSQKKLAMTESETVLQVDRLRQARMLPVDWRVDASGRTLMTAHLKIANGTLAPRVYFHDDTGGPTGKVHVGFVGPHEHMPGWRTN